MQDSLQHLIFTVKTPNIRTARKFLENDANQDWSEDYPQKQQLQSQNFGNHTGQISMLLSYIQLKPLKGISYSRQHISRLEKSGEFPRRFQLSPRENGRKFWWEHEIDEWLRRKASTRT
jgi:predicted DNA-binding transcriptional regulator AlpA